MNPTRKRLMIAGLLVSVCILAFIAGVARRTAPAVTLSLKFDSYWLSIPKLHFNALLCAVAVRCAVPLVAGPFDRPSDPGRGTIQRFPPIPRLKRPGRPRSWGQYSECAL